MNDDRAIARRFHDTTTHTPSSVRSSGHTLDWDVKPFPFKIYVTAPAVPLPRTFDPVAADTLTAIARDHAADGTVDLPRLAALLYLSAGVTKKKVYPGGGEVLFRAAASTGALYQTEVYVAAGDVESLAPGLYHFCPGDFTLRQLRDGDVRGALAAAAADETLRRRAAVLVLTAIAWRNTWKYQARGFRHLFWDSGTMLANVLATAGGLGPAPAIVTGFVDDAVNHVLGVDGEREAALELVGIGETRHTARDDGPRPPLALETMPLSAREVDYPSLRQMMAASRLVTADEVRQWRGAGRRQRGVRSGAFVPLPPPRASSGRTLSETIERRGSTRRFSHASLAGDLLATALWAATRPLEGDMPPDLVEVFLIINAVDGVRPGAYVYREDVHGLELVRADTPRNLSAYLCLEQPLAGDAAAVLYFLSPLDDVLAQWGNRGYRLTNLAAGIAGGRAYLAAYALGFGASGLTFYDRQVVDAFAPASAGMDAIFVTALGHSAREPQTALIDRISRAPD